MTNNSTASACTHYVTATDGLARAGVLHTAHGKIHTPTFMPVGTAGTVKGLTPKDITVTGTKLILANTYHLMLRPGSDRIARFGGLHKFMNWSGPILTDSGGYQVLSLAKLRKLNERGVIFRSHLDGTERELTPERAIEVQREIGSDISMVLDECPPYPVAYETAEKSMHLTLRWAERCRKVWLERSGYGLFGIVQGSIFPELRAECAAALSDIGFEGYAIGGLAVGENSETMIEVVRATASRLPANAPRYLMGVGKPDQLVNAVLAGIDMFDCVLPTRSGRNGQAFTNNGPINLRNAQFADDRLPLDHDCGCSTCDGYSRGYLHHLIRSREILGAILLTHHNVTFYQDIMSRLRDAIIHNRSIPWANNFIYRYNSKLDS